MNNIIHKSDYSLNNNKNTNKKYNDNNQLCYIFFEKFVFFFLKKHNFSLSPNIRLS